MGGCFILHITLFWFPLVKTRGGEVVFDPYGGKTYASPAPLVRVFAFFVRGKSIKVIPLFSTEKM